MDKCYDTCARAHYFIIRKVEKIYYDRISLSISIKDMNENAFRNLKAEAARQGMKINDAATEAFGL